MISRFGILAPLVAVLVWADRKLTIDGCGDGFSPGPSNELFSAWRPPTGDPTGGNLPPPNIPTPLGKTLFAAAQVGAPRGEGESPGGGTGLGRAGAPPL